MWLFSSRKSRRTPRAGRPSVRPRVEALEDRRLLSAGALDPTFGHGAGYVTTALSSADDGGNSALAQPDGKIIVAGLANSGGPRGSGGPQLGLARYNTDGSLDTSFGNSGEVVGPAGHETSAALYSPTDPSGNAGKIVVGFMSTSFSSTSGSLFVARYNANGSLDTSFGRKGIASATFNKAVGTVNISAVVIQPNGQIVAFGDNGSGFALARYNANGSLDTSFGSGGTVYTAISTTSSEALALQADGKLVAVGDTASGGSRVWELARYNANGTLDTNFGNKGFVSTALSGSDHTTGVAVYPNAGTANDGKIVAVGFGDQAGFQWEVARYTTNGSLDSTFGTGGEIVTAPGEARAVALAADGKVVVSGTSSPNANFTSASSMLARYNADGTPDSTFGTGGVVTTRIGAGSIGCGVVVESNGDIAVAEQSYNGSKWNFAAARYLASEPQIGSFTASPNPVTSGTSLTLTASNITDGNPGATITQVAFYVQVNGTNTLLGYGTQTSPGVWTFSFTVSLAPGTYTLFAQAEDNYGVFGDLVALTLTVQ
jgi:uncharacterized delta-60 repeat protein